MKTYLVVTLLAGGACLAATPALASPLSASFILNQSACCGSGPFGTVTLTEDGAGGVDVLLDLASGVGLVDTGSAAPGNHPDFAWTLDGSPSGVSVSIVQDGGDDWTFYDVQGTPVSMSDSVRQL